MADEQQSISDDLIDELVTTAVGNIRPVPVYPEWQLIETAPADGRRVLVWAEHYHAPCSAEHNGIRGWCVMGPPLVVQPTHWMPLPAPPR